MPLCIPNNSCDRFKVTLFEFLMSHDEDLCKECAVFFVFRVQERARKPRSGAAGWSHKVRRRWSKLQKKSNQAIGEFL